MNTHMNLKKTPQVSSTTRRMFRYCLPGRLLRGFNLWLLRQPSCHARVAVAYPARIKTALNLIQPQKYPKPDADEFSAVSGINVGEI